MKRHNEEKERKKRLAMSLFIVAIMTLSVLGYMAGRNGEDTTTYKSFKFFKSSNMWATKINGNNLLFHYHPSQVDYINISSSIIQRINNSLQIYQTSDENSTNKQAIALAQFEIVQQLSFSNKFIVNGFTDENQYNLPVITCLNATENIPVLMFEKYNETSVGEENNCILIKARSDNDFIALKDRILYGVLGIIG